MANLSPLVYWSQTKQTLLLKVDFDRWRTEDDAEVEEKPRDVRQDYEKEYAELQKRELGYIKG